VLGPAEVRSAGLNLLNRLKRSGAALVPTRGHVLLSAFETAAKGRDVSRHCKLPIASEPLVGALTLASTGIFLFCRGSDPFAIFQRFKESLEAGPREAAAKITGDVLAYPIAKVKRNEGAGSFRQFSPILGAQVGVVKFRDSFAKPVIPANAERYVRVGQPILCRQHG